MGLLGPISGGRSLPRLEISAISVNSFEGAGCGFGRVRSRQISTAMEAKSIAPRDAPTPAPVAMVDLFEHVSLVPPLVELFPPVESGVEVTVIVAGLCLDPVLVEVPEIVTVGMATLPRSVVTTAVEFEQQSLVDSIREYIM